MKNIHVLPTDKPSRLSIIDSQLIYSKEYFINPQHIYITSDEEIKEGDWYISILENEVYKATKETQNIMSVANLVASTSYKKTHFKIILTTDQDLIKDGIQSIDDEFLEWFVKNPSCEFVEVNHFNNECKGECDICDNSCGDWYKIIIPKEEPKQEPGKETADYIDRHIVEALVEVAKQKMYSEEDMRKAFKSSSLTNMLDVYESFEEFIEQFKNK
jgi:hypothetical protein